MSTPTVSRVRCARNGAKIQGRFIDLPVNTGVDEQIALLGKAIESDHESTVPSPLSEKYSGLDKSGSV